jgi:hypothetical protein
MVLIQFSADTFFQLRCLIWLPQRGCILQPRVAVAATLGKEIVGTINRNAVCVKATVSKLGSRNRLRLGKLLFPVPG